MKKRLLGVFLVGLTVYLVVYLGVRFSSVEFWERDGKEYVIFRSTPMYYLFRPLSYVDAEATGMQFHIGPHASNDPEYRIIPSVGDVKNFNSCQSQPGTGVVLTPRELCEIAAYRTRCNITDDCMVTCLVSTGAREVGGGCAHICLNLTSTIRGWTDPREISLCPKRTRTGS